ncbi:MAG: hypothetical protein HFE63_07445 [Clostridiales bacterium]|nr:hypothetical protein [Clostridiales bacterium]
MRENFPKYPIESTTEYIIKDRQLVELLLHPERANPKPRRRAAYVYDVDIVRNPFGSAFMK